MDKQKRNAGITLIALVISIIIMLILAGVSINATVGENGILKQAMEASNKQKLAQETENLNLELAKLNIDTITNNEADSIQNIVDYLVKQGVIDEAVKTSSGAIAVGVDRETGSKYFFGKKGEHIYKISRGKDDILVAELTQSTSGGDITGGSSLVTADSFNNDSSLSPEEKGKFTVTSDATVAFMDTISGELCFYIKSGVHASIEIYADMTLTNEGIKRSAIDIEPGGTLDLYIGEGVTLTVDSGFGEDAQGSIAGKGGYAGIHVPWIDSNNDGERNDGEQAELNLYGEGTIIAIGGNASKAGYNNTNNVGGAGGGGAGAGIGGNGGNGGTPAAGRGNSGGAGQNCGKIDINNSITVYAYGGAGSSGAPGALKTGNAGGGGGYPGAGIGGGGAGGAGGTCCAGGGGYSGGGSDGEWTAEELWSENGLRNRSSLKSSVSYNWIWHGGSYFEGIIIDSNKVDDKILGGIGAIGSYNNFGHRAGDGGSAGCGGILRVSKNSNIFAYNGNMYTDGTDYKDGENECPIYCQAGIILAKYDYDSSSVQEGSFVAKVIYNQIKPQEVVEKLQYINSDTKLKGKTINLKTSENNIIVNLNTQGIGSGAGYIELSNGTYTVDSSLN